jgi:hypothetical protein
MARLWQCIRAALLSLRCTEQAAEEADAPAVTQCTLSLTCVRQLKLQQLLRHAERARRAGQPSVCDKWWLEVATIKQLPSCRFTAARPLAAQHGQAGVQRVLAGHGSQQLQAGQGGTRGQQRAQERLSCVHVVTQLAKCVALRVRCPCVRPA